MAFQAPVAFHDVVASFTVEQWMRMESWKKELYQNVVKEIHKTLLRLGYTIINPEVLFNIQKSDESCVRIDHSSAEKEHKVIGHVPDLLLRVKEENVEESHCSSEKPKIKDEKDTSLLPKPSCPVISSVASLNVKEEQMVCEFGDATEPRQTNNQDDNQLFIKQEEEVYLIDDYNTVGLETTVQDTPNPTAMIKQEMDNRDNPCFPDIIPVVVKEECDPMEDVATGHHSTAVVATNRHHPSSFDSDEERRRLVAILLEKRRNRPIPFIDILAWDPIKKTNDLELPRPPQVRAGHVRWCACGHCMPLGTDEESICCQEVMNVRKLLSFGMCICEVDYLRDDLVSREHLIALHRYHLSYKKRRFPGAEGFFDRNYRIIAYRAFTMWVHGYLGQNYKRRPIPACVVKRIRDSFSAVDEMPCGYTYEASRDCNAALLLDCDI